VSKRSRRPGREAIKQARKDHKKAERDLRSKHKAQGLEAPPSATIANHKCPFKTVDEEAAMRLDAVSAQIKAYRSALPDLLKRLGKITDPRNPGKSRHKLTVLMVYGILCFAFQMASRREATRVMTRPMFMENLRLLFPELESLPHHDTLARLLAQIDVSDLEKAHADMIRQLIRNKKFCRYLIRGAYPIAIDGTQKFKRDELWDTECLERKTRAEKKEQTAEGQPEQKSQYYVYVLEANLAFHSGMVIPLLSEILTYTQGDSDKDKQDCEQRAFRRLAKRLKAFFPHLSIMVLLDGLYANGPVMALCRQYKWDYMIVLKDDALPSVWEEIRGLLPLQQANRCHQKWGNRQQRFEWVSDIDYRYRCPITGREKKIPVHVVICTENWEEIAPGSTEVVAKNSRHVWISALPLDARTVHERCNLGARHRWGIEGGILVEKHQGYQYEHCFSYDWNTMCGYHYLMRIGHALNVLARYTYALAKHVYELGVRGLIALVRSTIAAPWIDAGRLRQIAEGTCQLRLE
jgi:hypothetical protein